MPRAGWAWTIPPQVLVGAGLGLALAGAHRGRARGRADQVVHGGWTIAARHAGVVLGLLLLAPVLTTALEESRDEAIRAGAAVVLDSAIPPLDKLARRAGRPRRGREREDEESCPTSQRAFEGRPGRRRVALARRRAPGSARPRGDECLLAPVPARGRARARRARTGRVHGPEDGMRRVLPLLVALGLVAAVVVPYLALGGASFEPTPVADPCQARDWRDPGDLSEALEQIVLSALDGAACELGVSREELVLAVRERGVARRVRRRARDLARRRRAGGPRRPAAGGRRRGGGRRDRPDRRDARAPNSRVGTAVARPRNARKPEQVPALRTPFTMSDHVAMRPWTPRGRVLGRVHIGSIWTLPASLPRDVRHPPRDGRSL